MFSFLRRKQKNKTEETIESQALQQPETIEPEIAKPTDKSLPSPVESPAEPVQEIIHQPAEKVSENIEEPPLIKSVEEEESKTDVKKTSFLNRLKQGLTKTRQNFTDSLASLVLGRKEIDDDLLDELEMILLTADVGIDATGKIIQNLTDQVSRKALKNPEALISALETLTISPIPVLAFLLKIPSILIMDCPTSEG